MKKIYKLTALCALSFMILNVASAKNTNDNEDTGQRCDEELEKQSQHKTKTNPKCITVY